MLFSYVIHKKEEYIICEVFKGSYLVFEWEQGMFLSYSINRGTFSDVNFRIKISDVFTEKGIDVQPYIEISS